MLKKSFLLIFVCFFILAFLNVTFGEVVPHPSLNIPNLCTFGQQSGKDWGDDDFSQTIFFSVSDQITDSLYLRIFDPDVGGKVDEIQGGWNTKTSFELYGGEGAYTNPDAMGIEPKSGYKSGNLLAKKVYGLDSKMDGNWVILTKVDPKQGELIDGEYIFKLIIDGIEGDDGNLYKVDLSKFSDKTTETHKIQAFSYEWAYRLPNEEGIMVYSFPFVVSSDVKYVVSHLWDFDNDNLVYLNTPTRPGLPAYSKGNNEWAVTKYSFGASQQGARGVVDERGKKHWFTTMYDILKEDFDAPWTFQINKGSFRNNDIVFNVADEDGNYIPMYSTAPPRSGLDMVIDGKVYEPDFIAVDDILFLERDSEVNSDITLAPGTVLPKGTVLAEGTEIHQDITLSNGKVIPAGTVLEEDVVLGKTIVLQEDTVIRKGSILVTDTEIAEGSEVYEGLAPGPGVLPSCNTVVLDASLSTDPDGNPLTFTWELGDGTKAYGERVIHTYRQPGSYVVSVIAKDNSGAINDAGSEAMTIVINAPPISMGGEDQWACVGETVRFDGSKSYDPDGTVKEYKWYFGDGTSSVGAISEHVYKKPGLYHIKLKVTDNSDSECNIDQDGTIVIVNDPPVAKAGSDVSGCDYTISFDGSGSLDPDGEITEYLWNFGDGNMGKGQKIDHTYSQPGNYSVKLTVSDDSQAKCNTNSDEMNVFINASPSAEAGPDRRVCENEPLHFDGTASFDPNGDEFYYEWDFGDGTPVSTQVSPIHAYKKYGKYTATLTLKDNSETPCAISKDTAVITVDTNPIAEAGPDQLVDIGQAVNFDGSGSTDPNGYKLTYKWMFGDLSEPIEGISPTHTYNKSGDYRVRLTVTNTANHGCNTDYDELKVTVNHPPTARAGTSIITHAGGQVTFDGSSSFDPDGSIAEYEWNFDDGTPNYTSPSPKATHSFADPGRYNVELRVRDNTGLPGGTDVDTVLVIVNFPPIAEAGESQTVCAGQVIFDASESEDPDGSIIAYEWDFGDGGRGSGGKPVHIYKSPGVYNVKLTVTDNSGTATAQDTDNTTVEINGPPAVDIGGDFQKTCPDIPTQFDATATTDPNGDDLTYTWDFGDGAKGEGPSVEHTYMRPGRFILNATANDGRGLPCSKNTASKVVVVNSLPLSDAGPDQHVNPSEDVIFNGGGSVDPDGSITKYMWDFGDGATAEGSTVKHAYPNPGKYNVTLTVEDDSGLSCNNATDEAVIRVNAPPVADAGPDQIDICSRTVQFDGKGSKDPDGNITVYEWDFGDGSPVGNGSSPTHTYLKPGTYTVTLKVTDDSELESGKDTDVMQVVINDPPIAQINGSNIVCPGGTATFNGKGSTDSDGTIIEYKWDFGDGSSPKTGQNVNHVYDEPGTYKVTLTVKDDSDSKCNTGSVQHEIRVNSAPIAEAGDDITTCVQTTDCSVTLEASKSQDPDGDYLTYYWDLGDGTTRKGIRIQHEYENPGVYTVTLTVVDDSGTVCNEATDTLEITANAPPEVEFGESGK